VRPLRIAIIAFAGIGIMVLAYVVAYPSVTLRYRLTVDAELDGQSKVGSGVIEVWYAAIPRILGASARAVSAVDGEAVIVKLGERDVLLVLLARGKHVRSDPEDIVPNVFGVVKGGFGPEDYDRIRAITGRRTVPPNLTPAMARLTNSSDPKSAVLFDPDGSNRTSQDLKLKRVEIEIVPHGVWPLSAMGITGTPITRALQKKVPWVDSEEGRKAFSRALYDGGFDPGGAVGTKSLLMRGR
jgi:hypothetical protein